MLKCNHDGDCREPRCSQVGQGPCFECRSFVDGAQPVPLPAHAKNVPPPAKFCVQDVKSVGQDGG